jgi:hypothetical protein
MAYTLLTFFNLFSNVTAECMYIYLKLPFSSSAGHKGGSVSSCNLPRVREESLAHTGMGEHGGRQPDPLGLGGEPDRLRAGAAGTVLRVQPHLLEPPPLRLAVDHHHHGDRPAHRRQLLNGTPHKLGSRPRTSGGVCSQMAGRTLQIGLCLYVVTVFMSFV